MKRKKILITGGSGKLGSYIIDALGPAYQVTVFDRMAPRKKCAHFLKGNISRIQAVEDACRDIDTVIHLAAIVTSTEPEKTFKVNIQGTYNLLESCAKNKVKRVIFASSISGLGFIYQKKRLQPRYLPIDEHHPAQPKDAYGLSKIIGEKMCQEYTRTCGIETICLRPPWIWFPEDSKLYEPFTKIHEAWPCLLWAYQDARDTAKAFCLAIEAKRITHETIFLSAGGNGTKYPTLNLINQYYPLVKKIDARALSGDRSLIGIGKAKKILGFTPQYTWHDTIDN